jgi:hypothetical protein
MSSGLRGQSRERETVSLPIPPLRDNHDKGLLFCPEASGTLTSPAQ